MRWNFPEIYFICFIFSKLPWARKHGLDCTRCQGMLTFDYELMSIRGDELHIHRIRSFASTKASSSTTEGGTVTSVHGITSRRHIENSGLSLAFLKYVFHKIDCVGATFFVSNSFLILYQLFHLDQNRNDS